MVQASGEAEVLRVVVSLVDRVLVDFDIVDLLTELTERCAEVLDISSAGLLLAGPRRQLQLMAATSERTRELELFQLGADEGPCVDCFAAGAPVSVPDLAALSQRWPRFVEAAVSSGFASVHAVPVLAAGTALGALGLFGTTRGELDEATLIAARTMSQVASVAILQGRAPTTASAAPSLRKALLSRMVVEQAKGFVRGRLDVSIETAFHLLRRYARDGGEHLSDVARALMSDPLRRDGIVSALGDMSAEAD